MPSKRGARLMVSQISQASCDPYRQLHMIIYFLQLNLCSLPIHIYSRSPVLLPVSLSGLKDAESDSFTLAGLCSRLQDMQRKGCSRVPRVQGDRQEQEERQHFREMEVFRVPRIWAQELPQLRQRRPHTRAEGGEMSEMLKMRAFRISDSALHIQTVNALPYSHLL